MTSMMAKSKAPRKALPARITDPRGSSEYNLGLGARRANEVAQVFFAIGVTRQQVRTVSFGKEHATGEREASWTLDRRADLVYSKSGESS
jgi:peptidoglycan-associated lipoprotein